MPVTRQQIIDEARTWLGTPFQDQCRLKGVGVDCVNFVAEVGLATGAASDIEFERNYRRSTNGETMLALFREYMDLIDPTEARPGDFFVLRKAAQHWHCMIVSARDDTALETEFRVIEADRKEVNEHRIDSATKRRIHSAYRIRGISD